MKKSWKSPHRKPSAWLTALLFSIICNKSYIQMGAGFKKHLKNEGQ